MFLGGTKKIPAYINKLFHKALNFQDPKEPEPNQDDAWSMFCRGFVAQVVRVDEWVGDMGCFSTFPRFSGTKYRKKTVLKGQLIHLFRMKQEKP